MNTYRSFSFVISWPAGLASATASTYRADYTQNGFVMFAGWDGLYVSNAQVGLVSWIAIGY